MRYTKPDSLKTLKTLNWPNKTFMNLSNNNFFIKIKGYITNMFYNQSDLLPISIGEQSFAININRLIILINFFFNLEIASNQQLSSFVNKITSLKKFIKKTFKIDVYIILNNYYLFLWKFNLYNNCTDKQAFEVIQEAKKENIFYVSEANFFYKIKENYKNIMYINKTPKNIFFYKLINPLFTIFNHKTIDCILITKIISTELNNLRKNHNKFIYCLKDILNYLFKMNKNLTGLKLIIKGRLTPNNRQTRRKQKKTIIIGKLENTKKNNYLINGSNLAYSCFGIINISLTCNIKKEMSTTIYNNDKNTKLQTMLFRRNITDTILKNIIQKNIYINIFTIINNTLSNRYHLLKISNKKEFIKTIFLNKVKPDGKSIFINTLNFFIIISKF